MSRRRPPATDAAPEAAASDLVEYIERVEEHIELHVAPSLDLDDRPPARDARPTARPAPRPRTQDVGQMPG